MKVLSSCPWWLSLAWLSSESPILRPCCYDLLSFSSCLCRTSYGPRHQGHCLFDPSSKGENPHHALTLRECRWGNRGEGRLTLKRNPRLAGEIMELEERLGRTRERKRHIESALALECPMKRAETKKASSPWSLF